MEIPKNIVELRQKYPQYDTFSDADIADAVYKKYYEGKMDYDSFIQQFIGSVYPEPEVADEPKVEEDTFTKAVWSLPEDVREAMYQASIQIQKARGVPVSETEKDVVGVLKTMSFPLEPIAEAGAGVVESMKDWLKAAYGFVGMQPPSWLKHIESVVEAERVKSEESGGLDAFVADVSRKVGYILRDITLAGPLGKYIKGALEPHLTKAIAEMMKIAPDWVVGLIPKHIGETVGSPDKSVVEKVVEGTVGTAETTAFNLLYGKAMEMPFIKSILPMYGLSLATVTYDAMKQARKPTKGELEWAFKDATSWIVVSGIMHAAARAGGVNQRMALEKYIKELDEAGMKQDVDSAIQTLQKLVEDKKVNHEIKKKVVENTPPQIRDIIEETTGIKGSEERLKEAQRIKEWMLKKEMGKGDEFDQVIDKYKGKIEEDPIAVAQAISAQLGKPFEVTTLRRMGVPDEEMPGFVIKDTLVKQLTTAKLEAKRGNGDEAKRLIEESKELAKKFRKLKDKYINQIIREVFDIYVKDINNTIEQSEVKRVAEEVKKDHEEKSKWEPQVEETIDKMDEVMPEGAKDRLEPTGFDTEVVEKNEIENFPYIKYLIKAKRLGWRGKHLEALSKMSDEEIKDIVDNNKRPEDVFRGEEPDVVDYEKILEDEGLGVIDDIEGIEKASKTLNLEDDILSDLPDDVVSVDKFIEKSKERFFRTYNKLDVMHSRQPLFSEWSSERVRRRFADVPAFSRPMPMYDTSKYTKFLFDLGLRYRSIFAHRIEVEGGIKLRKITKRNKEKILYSRLVNELVNKHGVDLTGVEVRDPRDTAVLHHYIRDERTEKMSVFFIKDGKVVRHQVLWSKSPLFVSLFKNDFDKMAYKIARIADKLEVDEVHIVHNHPQGLVNPSGVYGASKMPSWLVDKLNAGGDWYITEVLLERLSDMAKKGVIKKPPERVISGITNHGTYYIDIYHYKTIPSIVKVGLGTKRLGMFGDYGHTQSFHGELSPSGIPMHSDIQRLPSHRQSIGFSLGVIKEAYEKWQDYMSARRGLVFYHGVDGIVGVETIRFSRLLTSDYTSLVDHIRDGVKTHGAPAVFVTFDATKLNNESIQRLLRRLITLKTKGVISGFYVDTPSGGLLSGETSDIMDIVSAPTLFNISKPSVKFFNEIGIGKAKNDGKEPIFNDDAFEVEINKLGKWKKVPKSVVENVADMIRSFREMDIEVPYKKKDPIAKAIDEHHQLQNLRLIKLLSWAVPFDYLAKHKVFRDAFNAGMEYTKNFEIAKTWFVDKTLIPLLKQVPKDVKVRMWHFMQMPPDKVPEKAKPHVRRFRALLDALHRYAKDAGYDIGYVENYFPHIFHKWRVSVDGKPDEFYPTLNEAIRRAKELRDKGENVLRIGPDFPSEMLDMIIHDNKYYALLSKIAKDLQLEKDDVRKLLDELGVRPLSKSKFFGNFLQRLQDNPNYRKEFDRVMMAYVFGIIQKINQDVFRREMSRIISRTSLKEVKDELVEYEKLVIGYPRAIDSAITSAVNVLFGTVTPGQVKNWVSNLAKTQYVMDLGFMVSSSMLNGLQVVAFAGPLLGTRSIAKGYEKAMKALKDKGSDEFLELVRNGVIGEVPSGIEMDLRGRIYEIPLWMFTKVELMNRASVYFAAKHFAERKGKDAAVKVLRALGVPRSDEVYSLSGKEFNETFAYTVVNRTQFRAEKFNVPRGLASPVTKLIFPYKTFLINAHAFMYNLVKNTIKGDRTAARALGTFLVISFLLGGHKSNVLTQTLFDIADKAMKKAFGFSLRDLKIDFGNYEVQVGDVLDRGIPAVFGVDVSGALALMNPLSYIVNPSDALGRYVRAIGYIARDDGDKALREMTPRIVKKARDIYKVASESEYESWRGHKVVSVEPSIKNVVMLALGFLPPRVLEYFRDKERKRELVEWYKDEVLSRVDEIGKNFDDKEKVKQLFEELKEKRDEIGEELKKAKGEYKIELTAKKLMLQRALSSKSLFMNALKRQLLEEEDRTGDAILRAYIKALEGLHQGRN